MGRTLRSTGISDKHKAFAYEYVKDYNGTRAARAVGYKNPSIMARRLLDGKRHPIVAKFIDNIQEKNIKEAVLTREQILEELSSLAMRDIIDLCDEDGVFITDDLRKLPPYIRRCVDGLEVEQRLDEDGNVVGQRFKLKLVAKLGVIDMLAKHFGMYAPQAHNHSVSLDWDSMFKEEDEDGLKVIEGTIEKAGE